MTRDKDRDRRQPSDKAPAAPEPRETVIDRIVDEWGEQSFPASDPPGRLPPSLIDEDQDDDKPGRSSGHR